MTHFLLAGLLLVATPCPSVEADELTAVRNYADALIAHGRDRSGRQSSPLFATTLDRQTLKRIEEDAAPPVLGLTELDRMIAGANPMHDQNLYQVLYALTKVTGDERYAVEADASLAWFLNHC